MQITHTDVYRFSIPMHPFTIATGTMHYAQNVLIRVFTTEELVGVGECSAFPMITGETQGTCFEMAQEFARLWKGKDAGQLEERMQELHDLAAFNTTIKSAFDMALHDLAAKQAGLPLYRFLNGEKKMMETDLTIGIGEPEQMAGTAASYKKKGVGIIKVKLGKDGRQDIERIRQIRAAVGEEIGLRIDANQGWDYETALATLTALAPFNIQFCEQPMRFWDDDKLPALKKLSPVPLMADESVFSHYDAQRLIRADACTYINIKLAKSGGILEAKKIHDVATQHGIPCMMGGMLESRIALSAFAHVAAAFSNIRFYDMDTCMLGHKVDPVTGGVQYRGGLIELPDTPGIGADADEEFLKTCERVRV
ncbi:MAG: dipeptide epimerase [Williamsia sp.]|nr:dipeptide epimerase [Williamsia sp.]